MKTAFGAAVFFAVAAANDNSNDTTGIFGDSDQWKTGLIGINRDDTFKNDMFYWLFDSRASPSEDPLVVWLTGGPGCASEIALFNENGPYKFPSDMTATSPLSSNQYSWNNSANLLYVDQPIGTGFSKAKQGH